MTLATGDGDDAGEPTDQNGRDSADRCGYDAAGHRRRRPLLAIDDPAVFLVVIGKQLFNAIDHLEAFREDKWTRDVGGARKRVLVSADRNCRATLDDCCEPHRGNQLRATVDQLLLGLSSFSCCAGNEAVG